MITETLEKITKTLGVLSTRPSDDLQQTLFSELTADFAQLTLDLAAIPGWSAATGIASRATFDTATVTLPQLAQRVKAIIDDLKTRDTFTS